VRAEARDNVGVASVQFQVDGVDIGAPDTTAPFALNCDSTTLGDGPHVLTAVAWDAAGNVALSAARPVSLDNGPPVNPSSGSSPTGSSPAGSSPAGSSPAGRVVTGAADTVPPVVTLVGRGLLAAARLTRTTLPAAGVPVVVTFTATDAGGAGVAAVQLQRSVNGQAFRPVALTSPTATTVTVIVRPGTTTRFRARAVDTAGNIGDWATGKPFRLTVTQDTSRRLTFRGAWNSVRHSGVLGTTVHRAAAAGSSVSMRFTGSRVSWIGTRGPQQGVARVYVDGRRVATIDGYARATQRRAVLLTLATAPGKHLIEIRATGAHRPRAAAGHLDLDAIVVISS
jgi:hypothetical protein